MPEEDYGADTLANEMMDSLLQGENLDIVFDPLPVYDFGFEADNPIFEQITRISVDELTDGTLEGQGVFDRMMQAMKAHLLEEYNKNRITGAEYSKAYIEMSLGVMTNAVQFLLQKDQMFWAAANAQIAAANGLTEVAIAQMKYKVAQIEVKTGRAGFALTKLKLATETKSYGAAEFSLEQILPKQRDLLSEQYETQRAQTLDTRSDGATVAGQIGKQKDLYSQQITSYKRDAEVKVAKIWSDAWITQKTVDEGLLAPNQFTNAEIDELLVKLKENVDLSIT